MNKNPRIRLWTAPILLGLIVAVGLVAALVSDGLGDYLGWLALAIPVAVVLWYAPPRTTERDAQTTSTSDAL
jgi:hypothetical protein